MGLKELVVDSRYVGPTVTLIQVEGMYAHVMTSSTLTTAMLDGDEFAKGSSSK